MSIQKNSGPFLNYQEIVDRAHTEIESVRTTTYKWLISTVGAALTVIFAVGIYFTYKSSEDFKTHIREDFKALKETVEKRVDTELSKESIQTLINDKVSKRVDDIADKLIEDKITTKITPKIEESDKKLKAIDNQLKDALKISKDIEEVSNLMLTFIKAQSDDSEAFEQLGRWGVDKSFLFSNISLNMYETIRLDYKGRLGVSYLSCKRLEDLDFSKFSLSNFKSYLASLEPKYHSYLVKLIWERDNITKKDKMFFLVDVLNTSKSLNAKDYAGRLFATETNLEWDPFYTSPLLDKWKETKDTIK